MSEIDICTSCKKEKEIKYKDSSKTKLCKDCWASTLSIMKAQDKSFPSVKRSGIGLRYEQ